MKLIATCKCRALRIKVRMDSDVSLSDPGMIKNTGSISYQCPKCGDSIKYGMKVESTIYEDRSQIDEKCERED